MPMLALEDRILTAMKLNLGIQVDPNEAAQIGGLLVALRKIRDRRDADRHSRNLANAALAPFDRD